MSIFRLTFKTQYGKEGQAGISIREEGESYDAYAHGLDSALRYLKAQPGYAGIEIEEINAGAIAFTP